MPARVACLSPMTESQVRGLFPGPQQVEVAMVPDPPAQQAVFEACHEAHIVIADSRNRHRLDRRVLENMRNCILIQQPGADLHGIDAEAAAEYGIPVATAGGDHALLVDNVNRVLAGQDPAGVVNGVIASARR